MFRFFAFVSGSGGGCYGVGVGFANVFLYFGFLEFCNCFG